MGRKLIKRRKGNIFRVEDEDDRRRGEEGENERRER